MAPVYFTILLLVSFLYTCDAADPLGNLCNGGASSSRAVSVNIDYLLSDLVSEASTSGYSATSFGNGRDKVYGLAQCRGDVSSRDCSDCLENAAKETRRRCPAKVDARIWYDFCLLRYNKENFIGKLDTSYAIVYFNVENVTDPRPEDFNRKLGALIDKIRSEAVVPKNQGLGKGETKLSPFTTLYALAQCTRDLAAIDCAQCVAIAVGNFPKYCSNRKGCRAIYTNCYVRYELYPFFFPFDSSNPSTSSVDTTNAVTVHA
ncbi:cysteine-rich repeat secretory protein 55 [Ricinus communis]|uniref:DUF26 domain-containing protein 2, putative n=1 Tax=Ricinus communis TaxID=3988 RepID=B9SLC8_RICCO|nr:cysteine-rich repeat secretory protein 55 [Ricinus communis]EEF35603.1 DUF26 domain-containing protein 2 precursor, putative [Ricinus communis]|eukprot:XP_002526797.1 cysteine-rich repeat secretory protein 55 [Ricinus communis]